VFEIALSPPNVRILNVSGKAIKRWDIATAVGATDDASGSGGVEQRTLKVWLEFGIEQSYSFVVTGEVELGFTTGCVALPQFKALHVSREKGFVGIEARTNVELSEHLLDGMSRIGTNELPEKLYQLAQNPLLLAYKWLGNTHQSSKIEIMVKKHDDVCALEVVLCVMHGTRF
jgi:hypothetical protein